MKAVKFDRYGGVDVLHLAEVARPVPTKDQVLVRVKTAGINPGEAGIREGRFDKMWPTTFPSGEGSDFAGIVAAVGEGVKGIAIGDEVIGFTNDRASHAEFVAVDAGQIVKRPAGVPWEQAGALFVAGTTAYAAVKAVSLNPGDTLVVSGAAGGVGSIAVQLARNAGARVIGLASEANHKWLIAHGIVPIAYGEGLVARIRKAAGGQVDAFIDTYGHGYVELAIELGIAPNRIDTIIDFEAASKYGVKTDGNRQGATADVLANLAGMIAAGRLEIPIAGIYNLADVRDAYRELEKHHTRGKIVVVP
ncbi:MAG TPA: NADP-dependent oxidoreductase [Puia sp.]|nr:NADP-dependent oxidoreductase [Puia sp.]